MIVNATYIDALAAAPVPVLLNQLEIAESRIADTAGRERDEFVKARLALVLELRSRMTLQQKRELAAA